MICRKMNPKPKRPIGVTLFALVFLWIGCGGVLFFPIIAGAGAFTPLWDSLAGSAIHSRIWLKTTLILLCIVWYLSYVAYAIIGFGLWKLRDWARKSVIVINVVFGAACLLILPFLVRPAPLTIAVVTWSSVIPASIAWYMHSSRVRFAFGTWSPGQGTSAITELPPGPTISEKALVVTAVIATFAVFIWGADSGVQELLRSSGAYRVALEQVGKSQCAASLLGTPIIASGRVEGGFSEGSNSGSANLLITVLGPREKAQIEFKGTKAGGVWNTDSMELIHNSSGVQLVPEKLPCTSQ